MSLRGHPFLWRRRRRICSGFIWNILSPHRQTVLQSLISIYNLHQTIIITVKMNPQRDLLIVFFELVNHLTLRSPRGVQANMQHWGILVSEFEFQLLYNVHSQTNTGRKFMNPLESWVKSCHFRLFTKVDVPLNKETKQICILFHGDILFSKNISKFYWVKKKRDLSA